MSNYFILSDSKMGTSLKLFPVETRQEIFKHLPIQSLFSCALTDRQLCREIMPLLWRDPLENAGILKLRRIANTYAGCLPHDKIEYLRNEGISVSETLSTFEYPAFL